MSAEAFTGRGKVIPFPALAGVRDHFPTLNRRITGRRLAYLDTAATSLRPIQVVESEAHFLLHHGVSPHRSSHTLATETTEIYEASRASVATFVGAPGPRNVVFTHNATAALNLLVRGLEPLLQAGDEVVLSRLEHHANLVPWLMLAKRIGIVVRYLPLTPDGQVDTSALPQLLSPRTRIVSVAHVSNVLGSIANIPALARMAHDAGALVLVDASQSVGRMPVSLQDLGADALVFSAHKTYGPMGLGFLVGQTRLLEQLSPVEGGGEMIDTVSYEDVAFAPLPGRLEAGTGNASAVAAFPAAISLLSQLNPQEIRRHEQSLTRYALDRLYDLGGLRVLGPDDPEQRAGIISFVDDRVHHHDLAVFLDQLGVAVRAGHHCAQPLHSLLGLSGSVRASFGVYSTHADVDALISGIQLARSVIG